MTNARATLHDAFLDDHRHLTRGLSRMRAALERDEIHLAVELAEEVDRAAGPHIEFEEQFFYPELEEEAGSEFVRQLCEEHEVGRQAVSALLKKVGYEHLDANERDELITRVDAALDHAFSVGTMLSHVDELAPTRQAAMLERLEELRRRGRRWTDLGRRNE